MNFLKKFGLSVLFASVLALGTTSANAACKARLGDFDWSSANIHTAISAFILEKGYGCQVEVTKGSTTPIMAAHYDKQLDVITEVWYDNIIANYEPHVAAGTIMNIGVNTPDSQQAFYVDKTTADKYNLKSVEDMKDPKIAALFKDPEDPSKGRMTSCISGWTCYTVNLVKQKEYGLDKFYTNFDPGSGGALDAAIAGAFAKKKPIFTYYWAPTGLMGKVDLVRLTEPKFSKKCWDDMSAVVEDIKANGPDAYKPSCACEYRDMALTKSVLTEWAKAHPKETKFLEKYTVPTATVNKMLAFYEDESDGDMELTAREFLKTESMWKDWVPADVAKKVSAAL
ncbi:glycine betaine ABC transporter substrate-binding protein [Pelagibacteraceae bacterium]|nr:glycine betaine ABC transporter substrate-binding protein [Pelagibacteraceae bacterium]